LFDFDLIGCDDRVKKSVIFIIKLDLLLFRFPLLLLLWLLRNHFGLEVFNAMLSMLFKLLDH